VASTSAAIDLASEQDSSFDQTDYEKLAVLSAIILLTIIGNLSVVISILMRR
jgi:hypothetical protein